jgi:hypothetical protein
MSLSKSQRVTLMKAIAAGPGAQTWPVMYATFTYFPLHQTTISNSTYDNEILKITTMAPMKRAKNPAST